MENDPNLTTELLNVAILKNNVAFIQKVLRIYKTLPNTDPILINYTKGKIAYLTQDYPTAISYYRQILAINPELNPVRIELAQALFYDKQLSNAEQQFRKAKTVLNLPTSVNNLLDNYLAIIEKQNEWNIDFSFHYVRDTNINNTSNARNIENTAFEKNDDMLPQTAHGVAYSLGLSKDFNLTGKHYLAFSNYLSGENYWDNHSYDDISNRLSLGYRYKTTKGTYSLLPFYKKRWTGGTSYNWSNGVQGNVSHWLNDHFNLSLTAEYSKNYHFDDRDLNSTNTLLSGTLFWAKTPKQSFYLGLDTQKENVNLKRNSSDTNSVRLGWIQEWNKGISSRLSVGYSDRNYKDKAKLGGLFPLSKIRHDKIYTANLTLWKRDWHIWGITPKLNFSWKNQESNIPSIYSYTKKDVNIIFEKSF